MKFYVYAVCLMCLAAGAIFVGGGIWGVASFYYPELTVSPKRWNKVATIESFRTDTRRRKGLDDLSEKEIVARWKAEREVTIDGEKREGIRDILQMVICLIIVAPIFAIHWRLARRL